MEKIEKILKSQDLAAFIDALIGSGATVLAPVRVGKTVKLEPVASFAGIAIDERLTTLSAKHTVFPKVEKILEYRMGNDGVSTVPVHPEKAAPVILFGIRPCDVNGFRSLDSIFGDTPGDPFYFSKRQNLTIFSMACTSADDYCFCTSTGGGPGNTGGSDIQFTRIDNDRYLVEILTDKGFTYRSRLGDQLADIPSSFEKDTYLADLPIAFDLQKVVENVSASFNDEELWLEQSLRCMGCGACAFVCPTCACFDLQDEKTQEKGVRLRLWDSCGFSLFTLHTSGHNPREIQSQRWRQRIMHKYAYMPEKHNIVGCEGCGRCSRACPADMNIKEHLISIAAR